MIASANGYKAICFDLDGTLRHTVPLGAEVYREEAARLGFLISDEAHRETARWEHYYWANSTDLRSDSKKFEGESDAFWKNYATLRLEKMGASPEEIADLRPKLRRYFDEEYAPKDEVPPELYQLLPKFRSAGYALAVLSNRRNPFIELMDELSLTEHFDAVMAAGEIGFWKPNPKIFIPLLERFALSPKEVVYVGDNYYADVIGARNAGIKPVLYDPRDIFPDADCTRIVSFSELEGIL